MTSHQTSKRQFEDLNENSDNGDDDDDDDVTWGGKRSRYLYNYTLQIPDLVSDASDLSDSIHSIQSKSTIEKFSDLDYSSGLSYASDSDHQSFSKSSSSEFELNSSSSCNYLEEPNSSDSSSAVDLMLTKYHKVSNNIVQQSDNSPYDTDTQVIKVREKNLPPPACFIKCIQCRGENPNPYFQYCHTCFRNRMDYFISRPSPKPKHMKKMLKYKKEGNSFENVQESSLLISKEFGTIGVSSFSLKDNFNLKNEIKPLENTDHLCNICNVMPKNGVFNHGKVGHVYCCYPCAKQWWKKFYNCPVCNAKIKFVTNMISA